MLAVPLIVLGSLGLPALWRGSCLPRPGRVLRPTPSAYRDLGVACLALGDVAPPLEELSDEQFELLSRLIARLLHAYETADFDSFLALRVGDLAHAGRERAADVDEVRGFCRQLAVPEAELGGEWTEVLERFWRAYYAEAPVARFVPEGTRVELREEELRHGGVGDWERSFETLRDRVPGKWIEHTLVVPHRRSLARVAADVARLTWLDLELAFETRDAKAARLVTRFVWDEVEEEWFLQRAATVYTAGDRSERHLIL